MTDLTDRLRTAIATGAIRWMPGMLAISDPPYDDGLRLASELLPHVWRGARNLASPDDTVCVYTLQGDAYPDLDDPATLGCLLAQVRERYDPHARTNAFAVGGGIAWACKAHGRMVGGGESEGEALLAALECHHEGSHVD